MDGYVLAFCVVVLGWDLVNERMTSVVIGSTLLVSGFILMVLPDVLGPASTGAVPAYIYPDSAHESNRLRGQYLGLAGCIPTLGNACVGMISWLIDPTGLRRSLDGIRLATVLTKVGFGTSSPGSESASNRGDTSREDRVRHQ